MQTISYEVHDISIPLLPFRFHRPDQHIESKHCTPNWHENIEILVCIRGSATMLLDGRQYPFFPGDICIANAYCVHTTTQEEGLDYHCLIVDKKFCEANGIFTSDIRFQEHIRSAEALEYFNRIPELYEHYRRDDPCCIAEIRYAVLGFLCRLFRHHLVSISQNIRRSASSERIKRAVEFINTHFSEEISLQDVADYVGVSKYYLSREFRDFTGTTVFDTINTTRCTEAKRMIEAGSSVSAAALNCGFENLSYFTRAFKKHIGTLPSSFAVKKVFGQES